MSASASLAGLFPPESNAMGNDSFDSKQIPIHLNPHKDDYRLDLSMDGCDRYVQLHSEYLNSSQYKKWFEQNRPLISYLEENSKQNLTSTHDIYKLYDTLSTEQMKGKRYAN